MFYNKEYNLTSYFNYQDMNELVDKVEQLLLAFENIIDLTDETKYNLDMATYELNDFPYIEDFDILERNIMNLSFDFFQPPGYIKNKVWIEDDSQATYKNISYIDLNRIITDMNLLYKSKDETPTIWNLFTNENWDGETTLIWEE